MNPTPLRDRRGCEWTDFGNGIAIMLVRAPAKDVARELAKAWEGEARPVDPVHKPAEHPDLAGIVFRHAGHDWSVFIAGGRGDEVLGPQLSRELNTRVLSLQHEDTAGWTEYRVFDKGTNVETYTYGPDYADEIETIAEEMGEEFGDEGPAIMPTDAGAKWDHQIKDQGNDYRFRSAVRKVDASRVPDEKRMLDEAIRFAGAWLPGWAHFPWSDPTEHPGEPESDFAEAVVVRRD